MKTLMKMLEALRSEKGQTIIEYVLVLVLISLVIILLVAGPDSPIYNGLSNAANEIEDQLSP